MNFYPLYPGDYARDTAHLTLLEHGAYFLLLNHQYSTEKPLPSALPVLHRICRAITQEEIEAVNKIAMEFFPLTVDGRMNKRAARQIPVEQERIRIARENGKRGGRRKEPSGLASGLADGNPAGTQRASSPSPSPSKETSKDGTARKRASQLTKPFELSTVWKDEAKSVCQNEALILAEFPKFCDYWWSKGEARADWLATWRNWIRKAVEFSGGKVNGSHRGHSESLAGRAEAAERYGEAIYGK